MAETPPKFVVHCTHCGAYLGSYTPGYPMGSYSEAMKREAEHKKVCANAPD